MQGNIFLDPGTDLYKKVLELVPWQISCVQIAHLPKAKRVRPGLEQCHRCSVLLQNDDHILIETEHLPSAQAPRERFVAPVKVAIFILGYAPGEPQGPSPVAPPPRQVVPEAEVVQDPMEQPLAEAFAEQGLVRQDFAKGECWFMIHWCTSESRTEEDGTLIGETSPKSGTPQERGFCESSGAERQD